MADQLRRAGHGRAADGSWVTWTVAEGRRGRRWREIVRAAEAVRSSLLLETDPDGRFSHLELSTAAGLLTLHPEGDGTLHGNAVTAGGVEHVRGRPWSDETVVLLEGSPICRTAAIHRVVSSGAAGAPGSRRRLRISAGLALDDGPVRIEQIDDRHWQFDAEDPIEVDAEGLPLLDEGSTWPLEEDG